LIDISQARRQSGEKSLLAFMQTYLPSYCTAKFSRMHEEIAALLERASNERGSRLAVAAPRGHAKSTLVTLGYVLWSMCYHSEPYIVVLSNTGEQAQSLLANIKRELESNHRLREDFPLVCSIPPQAKKPKSWRRHEILTASNVMITAQGSGSQIRGRRHSQNRPTLIICDDLESQVSVRSADQRRALEEWFTSTVLKLGTGQTNVIVVGTVLHYDSLLAKLTSTRPGAMPGWDKHLYRAIEEESHHPELWERFENLYNGNDVDAAGKSGPQAARAFHQANCDEMMQGTRVLWPEREDYLALSEMRISEGRASFSAEKQNAPLSPEDAIFRSDEIMYWDDRFPDESALLASFAEGATFVGACDPSLGKAGRNRDDTAIVTLVKDNKSGRFFVLDADIRKRKPADIIDAVIVYHGQRKYELFGMESVQFQEFVATELRERSRVAGNEVPVKEIQQVKDKLGRVQRLQPLVASGGIQFSRRHSRLMEQLEQFPMGSHDDGPDALEMAVTMAQSLNSTCFVDVIYVGSGAISDPDDRMWTPAWSQHGW
jgi:predicted phage terminase large subunit-like protein